MKLIFATTVNVLPVQQLLGPQTDAQAILSVIAGQGFPNWELGSPGGLQEGFKGCSTYIDPDKAIVPRLEDQFIYMNASVRGLVLF